METTSSIFAMNFLSCIRRTSTVLLLICLFSKQVFRKAVTEQVFSAPILIDEMSDKHDGGKAMTFLSPFGIKPLKPGKGLSPCLLDLSDLSLVVPVKDNKQGILRLLTACLDAFSPCYCPREIILVDNLSSPPLTVPKFASWGLPLQVLVC